MLEKGIVVVASFTTTILLLLAFAPRQEQVVQQPYTPPPYIQPWQPPAPPSDPETPQIGHIIAGHQSYDEIKGRLKTWEQEAPDLVETGTYGKSSRGKDLWFIRVTNERRVPTKVVLITASLHGNEPWSTSTTMAYIGTMLSKYGKDPEITELINTRQVYFVPVASPDSYPHSRHVDGVDPNRNFPGPRAPDRRSVPPVAALQDLFKQIKPNAVISGHTYGRVYLHPRGDSTERCPNHSDFVRIVGEMGRLSRYRVQRACEMYNRPIYGTEVDWYYRNGAFAIVMEFGTHQRRPSLRDTQGEFDRTFKAVLHFIREAPDVQIQQYSFQIIRAAA
jgi:hypothetical protein